MVRFITNLKQSYRQGTMPVRFIYINTAIFLLCWIVSILFRLFHGNAGVVLDWLQLPASLGQLICQPWSVVTYMFMHADFFHLLFNMLWLYWFGQLFLYFFSERAFGGLYLFGGLCGALLYLVCYNLLPYFAAASSNAYLLGASASVLAITVATAIKEPDFKVRLFLFGELSLKYVAGMMVLMDLLLITSENAGGHIAHLGGALGGAWYAVMLRKGVDITRWINRLVDQLFNLYNRLSHTFRFTRKRPKMKAYRNMNDFEYRGEKRRQSEEVDRILEKLKKSGYNSLSNDEKKSLFDASKR